MPVLLPAVLNVWHGGPPTRRSISPGWIPFSSINSFAESSAISASIIDSSFGRRPAARLARIVSQNAGTISTQAVSSNRFVLCRPKSRPRAPENSDTTLYFLFIGNHHNVPISITRNCTCRTAGIGGYCVSPTMLTLLKVVLWVPVSIVKSNRTLFYARDMPRNGNFTLSRGLSTRLGTLYTGHQPGNFCRVGRKKLPGRYENCAWMLRGLKRMAGLTPFPLWI